MDKEQIERLVGVVVTLILAAAAAAGWYFPIDVPAPAEIDAQGVRYGQYGNAWFHGDTIVDGDMSVDGTTNIDDLDVDASGEIEIDGGLTDFGGCTAGVADGDNDVCIAAVLEVDGELEADGAIDADSTLDVAGIVTLAGLLRTSFSNLTVSDGDTITPTVTTYALDTSGAVTVTLAASASEGQLLILINDDANATVIADTNLASSDGNAITLAGADDVAVFIYQDAVWHELLTIADS